MTYLDTQKDFLIFQLKQNPQGLTVADLNALTGWNYEKTARLLHLLEAEKVVTVIGFKPSATRSHNLWAILPRKKGSDQR